MIYHGLFEPKDVYVVVVDPDLQAKDYYHNGLVYVPGRAFFGEVCKTDHNTFFQLPQENESSVDDMFFQRSPHYHRVKVVSNLPWVVVRLVQRHQIRKPYDGLSVLFGYMMEVFDAKEPRQWEEIISDLRSYPDEFQITSPEEARARFKEVCPTWTAYAELASFD